MTKKGSLILDSNLLAVGLAWRNGTGLQRVLDPVRCLRLSRQGIGFKPIAQISWTENGQERIKRWMEWAFEISFATYKDAEREADIFAKDWVDSNRMVTLELKK